MGCGLSSDLPVGGIPPSNPGPPPCMGLNCPGYSSGAGNWSMLPGAGGAGQGSCGASGYKDITCGPGVPTTTSHPVDLSTGYKLESATDLVVPLPGPDFMLSRSYSSQVSTSSAGTDTNLGLPRFSGWHWALNVTQCLYIDGYQDQGTTPPPFIALSTPAGTTRFDYDNAGTWKPSGGTAQFITSTTLQIGGDSIDVWRLTDPGIGSTDYDRRMSNQLGTMGLPLEQRDLYGHIRHFVWQVDTALQRPKLTKILVDSQSESTAATVIDFAWTSAGQVATVDVKRRGSGGTPQTVSRVSYTYFTPGAGHSSDVGTDGDLIQVQVWQPVDRSEDQSATNQLWHIVATQYRYHSGESGSLGKAHQLKAVIAPQQIEFAAQRNNSTSTPAWNTVKNYADSLLSMADAAVCFTDGGTNVTVRDLATKFIASYDASDRVTAQELLTGCGCSGGGATLGMRETYEYLQWPSGPTATGRTMVVREEVKDSSGTWSPVRTRFHDLKPFQISQTVRVYKQVHDAIGLGNGASGPYWVTRYDYSTTNTPPRAMTATYGPDAISAYTPAAGGSTPTPPTSTISTSGGAHFEYTYTPDGRLATVSIVRQGTTPATSILLRNTYDGTRPWLATRSELATAEGMTAADMSSTAFADRVQKTEFSYGFRTTGNPDAVAWMQARFEAETTAENGPGGDYFSHTLFDASGFPVFQRLADDSLVKRTFDPATGATRSIQSNAPSTGISSMERPIPSGGEFSWNGRNASGGSMTWTMTHDAAGRVRTLTMPGGAVNRYTRELRAFNSHLSSGDGRPGILYFTRVGLPYEFLDKGDVQVFVSPASVTWSDAAGVLVGACDYRASAKEDQYGQIFKGWPYGMASTPVARRAVETAVTGQVKSTTVWHDMAGNGDGAGRYTTTYAYDSEGRLRQTVAPNRTIRRTTYDALGRVSETSEGSFALGGDPDAATTYTTSLVRYDGATGSTLTVGNGLVTTTIAYTGETSPASRTTNYLYDWRGRLAAVNGPVAPYAVVGYDNLGRVTEAASLNAPISAPVAPSADSIAATRLSFASSAYSQRGMRYRTRIALVPTSTDLDSPTYNDFVESHEWYDPAGRIVGSWSPSGPMVKNSIDGLGRAIATYVVDRGTDPLPGASGNYAAVFDRTTFTAVLTNNVVLEQTFPQYRSGSGFLDLVKHQARVHTLADTVTGSIDGATKSVTTWTAVEYDTAGRTVRHLDFGTNLTAGFNGGGLAPTASGTPLTWSGNVVPLVEGVEYEELGRAYLTVVPRDSGTPLRTRNYFDATGAIVGTIANWDGTASLQWNASTGRLELQGADPKMPDQNQAESVRARITEATPAIDQIAYTFAQVGGVWTQKFQTTRTLFGVSNGTGSGDSRISSNDLVAALAYPDATTGAPSATDRHIFAYDRQGMMRWKKDQRGVEHTFTFDAGGRIVNDEATGGDTATDDWADAVAIAYDANGRLATIKTIKRGIPAIPDEIGTEAGIPRSTVTPPATTDTILNAVGLRYSAIGLPEAFDQNPLGELTYSGTTPVGTTKRVGSSYSLAKLADGNWVRGTGTTYPGGQVLNVGYGTAGVGYRISRPQSLGFAGATAAAESQFLGLATPVVTSYPGPGVRLDRSMGQAGVQADGQYPSMDAFGRVTRQLWIDSGYAPGSVSGFANKPAIVDTTYAYTRLGGLTGKLDARPGATMLAQHAYTLDGLLRLLGDQRGSAAFPSTQAKPGSEDFTYDFIGNIPSTRTDTSTAGTFATGSTDASTSTFDLVNQVTGGSFIPLGGTPQSIGFTWDAGGNLRERGIAGAPGTTWRYKHDRWGRLTQVDLVNGTTVQPALRAQYSGLGMRCVVDRAPDSWVPPAAPTISQRRIGYFNENWQLLEEYIDNDLPLATSITDIDQVEQLVWGMRYVDDLVLRRVNANFAGGTDTDFTDAGDRAGDQFLNDTQFSVVAVIDNAGALLERVEYDPYGQAQHHWPEGITGAVASGAVGKSIGQTGYLADADLDRDGTVSLPEANAIGAKVGTAGIPAGRISAYGNTVGWCGYRFNAGPNICTVRFRHFDPTPGVQRWLERDPAGYMDGASLYSYLEQRPTMGADPRGLFGNVAAGALVGGLIGGIAAAINGEDILVGAARGGVVGAIAGATFGASIAIAGGVESTSALIAAGVISGMAGTGADTLVTEGRVPTARELAVGGAVGGVLGGAFGVASKLVGRIGRNSGGVRGGAACFLAGTLVLTASPEIAVPIESLRAGDVVASVDPVTGEATTAVVDATCVHPFEGTVYDITVATGEAAGADETRVSVTGEHPFLVARAGAHAASLDSRAAPEAVSRAERFETIDGCWVAARDLAEGDTVRTMSAAGVAGTATITQIGSRHAVAPVYNLTVRGTSRYLVGACGVVVHNKGEGAGSLTSLRQQYVDEVLLLEDVGLNARAAGMSVDDTARMLHGMRRELGRKFKELTPALERERIRVRNLEKYGDELGPTIEYFRERGRSWQDILDSACRPGGRDLGY
ncbi:MAG: DUF6531 domain-containing protein [Phycisphaerales bacterium]